MLNMIMNVVKWIFFTIDSLIYLLIELFFDLFFNIVSSNFLTSGQIAEFSKRIYLFIGIFMLFRISISLVNSIVNPDNLTDKEKGISKIITRILVVLVLLVFTPTIFSTAKRFQMAVVKEQVITKALLTTPDSPPPSTSAGVGKEMSNIVFSAFFSPNDDCETVGEGLERLDESDNKPYPIQDRSEAWKKITWECDTKQGVDQDKVASYDYKFFISTIAGLLIAWIILNYCIEVAIRVIKLAFLQLLAPIPIMTYIDPQSSKSGAFNNWVKACTTVYIDLFVRLIIIYFTIYIFQLLFPSGGETIITVEKIVNGVSQTEPADPFVQIAIIIGLLMFAQQAPKLLKDLFGIKDSAWSGNMGLSAIAKTPGLNRVAGFATGAAGGAISGLGTGGLKGMGAGLLSGGLKGQKSAASSKKIGGIFGSQKQAVYQKNTGTTDDAGLFGRGSWVQQKQKSYSDDGIKHYTEKLRKEPAYVEREQARSQAVNKVEADYKVKMDELNHKLDINKQQKIQAESNANVNRDYQIETRTKASYDEGIKNGTLLTDGKVDNQKVNTMMEQIRMEENSKFEKQMQSISSQYEANERDISLEKQNLTNSLDSQKELAIEDVDKLHPDASDIQKKLDKVETAKQQAKNKKMFEEALKDLGYKKEDNK